MGAVRMTRRGKYVDKAAQRYLAYKRIIKTEIEDQLEPGFEPIDAAIGVVVWFYMPIPKSWPKAQKEAANGQYCTTKPDIDNLVKGLFDAVNGLLWVDDNRIVVMDVYKVYGRDPGIELDFQSIGALSHGQTNGGRRTTKRRD